MKNKLFIILLLIFPLRLFCLNSDSFSNYDNQQITKIFHDSDTCNDFINAIHQITFSEIINETDFVYLSANPLDTSSINAPGRLSSFWFTFVLSAVGTYTLYGAGAGPLAFGIVYFSSRGNKVEAKKAFWGFLIGTTLGIGLKLLIMKI